MKIQKEVLTSRQNDKIKWVASLKDKKHRDEYRSFIAEGIKLTLEAAGAGASVTHIFISQSRSALYIEDIKEGFSSEIYSSTELVTVSDEVFEKISTEKSPQGVISVIKYLDFFSELDIIYKEEFFLRTNERALALCSLRDPGNLGAIIRSAVAFGTEHIILTSDSADVYNPKTVRAAMGGIFKIRFTYVRNFAEFITKAQDNSRRVFAAELTETARSLEDIDVRHSDIFVIGNEGHGIPLEISSLCTNSVYIPIAENTESLNASVAASLILWEQKKAF